MIIDKLVPNAKAAKPKPDTKMIQKIILHKIENKLINTGIFALSKLKNVGPTILNKP
jgi:hypothetical protein